MRPALLRLVAQLTDQQPGALDWTRVILLHNFAAIPPARSVEGDAIWNRGFNLLLTDGDGTATHFCKCRPESDVVARHECRLMTALSGAPDLADVIAATRCGSVAGVSVQASEALTGRLYEKVLPELGLEAWLDSVADVQARMSRVASRAVTLLPELAREEPVRLAGVAAPSLAFLRGVGAAADDLDLFARVLERAPTLRPAPQHGDLWPRNVIGSPTGWRIIDLEMLAEITVPLYDFFHLLRTSARARLRAPEQAETFLSLLEAGDEPADRMRRLIAAEAARQAVPPDAVPAAYTTYLARWAHMVLERAQVDVALRPAVLGQLARLAAVLRDDDRTARVFGG